MFRVVWDLHQLLWVAVYQRHMPRQFGAEFRDMSASFSHNMSMEIIAQYMYQHA